MVGPRALHFTAQAKACLSIPAITGGEVKRRAFCWKGITMTTNIQRELTQAEGQLKAFAFINRQHFVEILPSTHRGYFYIMCMEAGTGTCDYSGKPILIDYVAECFELMGADIRDTQWRTKKCEPYACSPYTEGHPSKAEQLVYFIEGASLIKIGISQYPEERMKTLQDMSPVPLRLLATCKGGPRREAELHRQFSQDRRQGEWFEQSRELQEVIEQCKTS